MTYREQIDHLLGDCTRKADAYIEAMHAGNGHIADLDHIRQDWEGAESAYECCLDLIRAKLVRLDDEMPAQEMQTGTDA